MLRRFFVDNFKTLVNVSYEPAGVNLLLGKNNAGKTNLCYALRFLGLTSRFDLAEAARRATGSFANLRNLDLPETPNIALGCNMDLNLEGSDFQFEYSLTVECDESSQRRVAPAEKQDKPIRLVTENLRVTGGAHYKDRVLLENKRGNVSLFNESSLKAVDGGPPYVRTSAPAEATMLCRLYDSETNRLATSFQQALDGWRYYDLENCRLRGYEAQAQEAVLNTDGSNLASVLYNLKVGEDRTYRLLLETLRAIEPDLDALNFFVPSQEKVFMFMEDKAGNKISADLMSNGTLRFSALAYVFLHNALRSRTGALPTLTLVEEPENSLYAGYLKTLLEKMDMSGKAGQYVFTSHSPYFIDLFDENIEGVSVLKKIGKRSTLEKCDAGRIRKELENMALGEMHFREMLT